MLTPTSAPSSPSRHGASSCCELDLGTDWRVAAVAASAPPSFPRRRESRSSASAAAAQRRRLRPTGSSRTSTVPPVAPALSCSALALAAVNPHANVPSVRRHHHCPATCVGGGPPGVAPQCLAGQVVWGSGAGAIRGTLSRRARWEVGVDQSGQGHGPCSASVTRRTNPGPAAPPHTEQGRENHRRLFAASHHQVRRRSCALA